MFWGDEEIIINSVNGKITLTLVEIPSTSQCLKQTKGYKSICSRNEACTKHLNNGKEVQGCLNLLPLLVIPGTPQVVLSLVECPNTRGMCVLGRKLKTLGRKQQLYTSLQVILSIFIFWYTPYDLTTMAADTILEAGVKNYFKTLILIRYMERWPRSS